jgi:(2Fe-2S) ferredoxin
MQPVMQPAPQQLPALPQPWGRRLAGHVVCGGLKKETKKLAKTLEAHRKRLESLLTTQTAAGADAATMQLVLSEISQLKSAVDTIREVQEQQKQQKRLERLARRGSSSSDSDSSDDESPSSSSSSRPMSPSMASMVVAAGSVSMLLEPPAVDQEQPDITQQLPPPQQYNATGRILVCQGKACMNKGALGVLQAASHAAAASPGIEVLPCKCLGKCKQGPALRMRTQQPGCTLLTQVSPLEVPDAVDAVFSAADAAAAAVVAAAGDADEQQPQQQQPVVGASLA